MSSADIIIYGASDDLVEFEGAIRDEFDAYGPWVGQLTSPDGESLIIRAEFGAPAAATDWKLSIENTATYPAWPIRFGERPGCEGDPAIIITAPTGTTIKEIK